MKHWHVIGLLLIALFLCGLASAQERNLYDVPSDLSVPPLADGPPAAGKRVKQINPGYEGWDLFHVLYLPADWQPGGKYPVIVEYPGNGGYKNSLGDVCTGKPEDCSLGYGLSGGCGMIWICLPFVNRDEKKHQLNWWGDPDATAAYCVQTVNRICAECGGDSSAVFLTGFSRGAIACNYIGLRNEEIARLWRGLLPHSHYDGVRKWPYHDSDVDAATARLKRLGGRPQFITQESTVEATRAYLDQHAPDGKFTFLALPYPNHSDQWVLKNIPERAKARAWLAEVLQQRPNPH